MRLRYHSHSALGLALLLCRAQAAVFRCEQIGGSSKPPLSPTSCNCRGVIGRTPATPSPSSPTQFLLLSFSSLSRPLLHLPPPCLPILLAIAEQPEFLSPLYHQQQSHQTQSSILVSNTSRPITALQKSWGPPSIPLNAHLTAHQYLNPMNVGC